MTHNPADFISQAERRQVEREKLLREALMEQFPELSEQEIVEKEQELRLIIGQQLRAAGLTPTNMDELPEAQDERWSRWIASADHTNAELWIAIDVEWWQRREEIRALERRSNDRR